jgi:hypothetical protein
MLIGVQSLSAFSVPEPFSFSSSPPLQGTTALVHAPRFSLRVTTQHMSGTIALMRASLIIDIQEESISQPAHH